MYGYADDDPLMKIDLNGESPVVVSIIIVGGMIYLAWNNLQEQLEPKANKAFSECRKAMNDTRRNEGDDSFFYASGRRQDNFSKAANLATKARLGVPGTSSTGFTPPGVSTATNTALDVAITVSSKQ